MSSLARDRASREDACKDGEWRSHVCEAEEERRLEELEREKARAEQESKRRVEEIAMRLEAEERERQREAAWEKEECARNRMASLARDRASRGETREDDAWRHAHLVQHQIWKFCETFHKISEGQTWPNVIFIHDMQL